ncbi:uncharacterized protein RSE6_02865 [Rhynchosporium secalis]|uniref:Uncharacterized protein n=1 Tax=Rhynchosporium secalis TaxID=38038 RepID=A0A1E1M1B6_RHYSE|nr:uncharacterized protein RSE6_02865 [Rhynchosporium secalis]
MPSFPVDECVSAFGSTKEVDNKQVLEIPRHHENTIEISNEEKRNIKTQRFVSSIPSGVGSRIGAGTRRPVKGRGGWDFLYLSQDYSTADY